MNVTEYINQHTDICYCEAIVDPNGGIEDAIPGHVYYLINYTCKIKGICRSKLDYIMPNDAGPIPWLVEYSNCMSLWFTNCITSDITDQQLNTLKELQKNNVIANPYIIDIKKEKSLIDIRNLYGVGE